MEITLWRQFLAGYQEQTHHLLGGVRPLVLGARVIRHIPALLSGGRQPGLLLRDAHRHLLLLRVAPDRCHLHSPPTRLLPRTVERQSKHKNHAAAFR